MGDLSDLQKLENYIGGEFLPTSSYIKSYNPSTGEHYLDVPDSGPEDVEKAVEAARKAFKTWSKTSGKERARLMNAIADLVESRMNEFAEAESRDQGKPVWLAKAIDIPRVCYNMRAFASGIMHQTGISFAMPEVSCMNYTHQQPVGVAGLISPWNLPAYLLTFKIAPALAAGCTVVCKPSEMTSMTAYMLAKVMDEVGLPPGVCNIVFGTGPKAGEAIVTHPQVPVISFTGSTATGKRIQAATAPFVKKLSLELGGKNAGIVFADADLDKCLPVMMRSSFINQGEVCLTTSRIFVEEPIFESFVQKFVEKAKNIKVGDPTDSNNMLGALISKEHLAKVQSYVELAKAEGCTINCGLEPLDLPEKYKNGYFFRPTVITNVSDTSRLMTEEIFGPVVCIVPFKTEEEVIERANSVDYGLCACIWTENVRVTHRVAPQLHVGTVWVNCWMVRHLSLPFGGCKYSGIGREGVKESMELYTDTTTICVKYE